MQINARQLQVVFDVDDGEPELVLLRPHDVVGLALRPPELVLRYVSLVLPLNDNTAKNIYRYQGVKVFEFPPTKLT